jgi:hypothetical protein
MYLDDVRQILTDPAFSKTQRLLRLQGLRGADLTQGEAAGWAVRLGPAQCAVFGLGALLLASAPLYLVLAVPALIGGFAPNHPLERGYSWWARRTGRVPLPANRAARRSACLAGGVFFLAAAWGLAIGPAHLFWVAGISMVLVPGFVTLTNLCAPSLVFTLLFGAERASSASLIAALGQRSRLGSRVTN